jgi:cytochrome P450
MTKLPGIPRWQSAVSSFKMAKNPLPFLNKFIREKGPTVQVYLGGLYKMILTTDPDFIQHILQKNNKNYRKSEVHFDKIQHFLGRGLLTSEGPYWLQQRRLIQPGFHKKRLEDLLGLMDKVAIEVLDELDEAIQIQPQVDMYEKMLEITFRIIANSIFGQDLGQEQLARLSDSITQLQEFIVRQIRQPYYNTWFKLSGKVKEHEVLRDEADAIIHHYIEERRKSKEQHSDLLQMLMEARYEDTGEGMTDQQLIDEVKILFVAGHDTSSNALAWTWYLLGLHPEALEKVRKEVDQIIGEEQPSFEKIMQLEYTSR